MSTLEVIGAPQSNYVRTVRMACREKGVEYTLTPVLPHSPDARAAHVLGKIPGMRHGSVVLGESRAICGYIDAVFDGPKLVPSDPAGAAMTEQWISLYNTAIDPLLVRTYLGAYFFSGLPKGEPDRARIDGALPKMREMFALLDRELGARPYLAGPEFTLADMFLLPAIHYERMLPESGEMLRASPHVEAWFERVSARPSAVATAPPPMPARN